MKHANGGLVLVFLVSGCFGSEKPAGSADAAPNGQADAAPTVRPDAAPFVRPDATPDIRPDATPDIRPDATPDIRPDAAPDVRPDAAPGDQADAAPVVQPDGAPIPQADAAPTVRPDAAVECPDACVFHVSPGGSGDGSSWAAAAGALQPAIDAASAAIQSCGFTSCQVWVAGGTYYVYGSGTNSDHRKDTINLASGVEVYGGFAGGETRLDQRDLEAHRTILDGLESAGSFNAVFRVLTAKDIVGGLVLDGLTITHGRALGVQENYAYGSGGGLYHQYGNPGALTVRNCLFLDNEAMFNGGAVLIEQSSPTFVNTTFVGNKTRNGDGGALWAHYGLVTLDHCTIAGNGATDQATSSPGGGVYAEHDTTIKITNSILWKNSPDQAAVWSDGTYQGYVDLSYSVVYSGYAGLGNLSANPRLLSTATGEVRLRSDSPCIDAAQGNEPATDGFGRARMGAPDLGAVEYQGEDTGPPPPTCYRYVAASPLAVAPDGLSWATAFSTVQPAIDSAWTAIQDVLDPVTCEVWVAAGKYQIYQVDSNDTLQLRPEVELYGGFAGNETSRAQRDWAANVTTLDGCYSICTNYWASYHVVTGTHDTVLDGFTVTHGNATGGGWDDNGGGMFAGCQAVRNCIFTGNSAAGKGGGLYTTCDIDVENTEFLGNSALDGGGMNVDYGTATITGSTFSGNSAWPTSIEQPQGEGGGLRVYGGKAIVTDTSFTSNSSEKGGALHTSYASATLTGCTFDHNDVNYGGGGAIYTYGGGITASQSTFSDNSALNSNGGAVYLNSFSTFTCPDCTFSNNYPDDVYDAP